MAKRVDVGALLLHDDDELARAPNLLELSRANAQLLFDRIWELPKRRVDEAVVVELPEPSFALPRARRPPKPEPPSRWKSFAERKGIRRKPKDKATWDDQLQAWVPAYGYKRRLADKNKDWVMEVPENVSPMTDMFAQKAEQKSERVAKNELQRLKNVARARKIKLPRTGFPVTSDRATASQLSAAVTVAKSSTASVGKFQPKLPKEKEARGKNVSGLVPGSERKTKRPFMDLPTEKKNNLNIIEQLSNKRPKLDFNLGATQQIQREEVERAEVKKQIKNKPRGKSNKGNKRTFVAKKGKKPTGGKGQRNPSKRTIGRKRR